MSDTQYVVLLRDHAGDWHAIAGPVPWHNALGAFTGMLGALRAIDYYLDFPPAVVKIVRADGAGQDYYAQAPALGAPEQ